MRASIHSGMHVINTRKQNAQKGKAFLQSIPFVCWKLGGKITRNDAGASFGLYHFTGSLIDTSLFRNHW